MMQDIRDSIFREHLDEIYTGKILPHREGILSGAEQAIAAAKQIGMAVTKEPTEGELLRPGRPVMVVEGTPKQMAILEDTAIGLIAKTSGIATSANIFQQTAGNSFKIVCGSWKKVNASLKESFRKAIVTGGCKCRMLDEPMVYLDKNYVIMLGGVDAAIKAAKGDPFLANRKLVVQAKGIVDELGEECWMIASSKADYLYLDTGNVEDLNVLADAMQYAEHIPKIAFGGNVTLETIEKIKAYSIDFVGVGRAIIDAPMIDMSLDVIPKKNQHQCTCHSQDHSEHL